MTTTMTRRDLIGYLVAGDPDEVVVLEFSQVPLNVIHRNGEIYLTEVHQHNVVLQIATKSDDILVGLTKEEWENCFTLPRGERYDYIIATGNRMLTTSTNHDYFVDGTGDDEEVWGELEVERREELAAIAMIEQKRANKQK